MLESENIESVTVNAEVAQDRLTITDDDRDGDLYVTKKWESQPLGSNETVVTLKATSENGQTNIALDSAQLDALIDALYHTQEAYRDE